MINKKEKILSVWGANETQYFYNLTPEVVLNSIEKSLQKKCTGRCLALNSMENRVYEIELDVENPRHPWDRFVIAKFYRPGRWSAAQIQEEHYFIQDLHREDLPVVVPISDSEGNTVLNLEGFGIYYTIFPKIAGRAPYELESDSLEWVGRLLGRLHGVGSLRPMEHRMSLTPEAYGEVNLAFLSSEVLHGTLKIQYEEVANEVIDIAKPLFADCKPIRLHGDAHLGNLLWNTDGPFWVDFDDCLMGPPIQDLWLVVGGRDISAQKAMSSLIKGYQVMKEFDKASLRLIESLRGLRMIHFCSWIARRRKDPAFVKVFPDFGSDNYWISQIADLKDQVKYMKKPSLWCQ